MLINEVEQEALDAFGASWSMHEMPDGWTYIVIHDYRLPAGFAPGVTDLMMRLHPQFPDAPPDMFYVSPTIVVARTGQRPQATETDEAHLERTWQRFSRHLGPGAWGLGDDLCTWLAAIRHLLRLDVRAAA
jgi:hypothetical protein